MIINDFSSPSTTIKTIRLDNDKLHFKGNGGTDKKDYEVTLNFFGKVKCDESKYIVRDRGTEFVLYKEEEKWWTKLLNENTKFHWLKVDFNKWKDDDESGDEAGGAAGGFNDSSYEDMMRQFGGGAGGGGAPDFSNFNLDGMGGDEKDDEEEDEPLPGKILLL